jgi:hypothetical protein
VEDLRLASSKLDGTEHDYGVGSRSVEAHSIDLAKMGIRRSYTRHQIEPINKSVPIYSACSCVCDCDFRCELSSMTQALKLLGKCNHPLSIEASHFIFIK